MAGRNTSGSDPRACRPAASICIGELAGAIPIELALQEQPGFARLDAELLGDPLHVVAIAGQPRLKVVDMARDHSRDDCRGDLFLADLENPLEGERQALLHLQRRP